MLALVFGEVQEAKVKILNHFLSHIIASAHGDKMLQDILNDILPLHVEKKPQNAQNVCFLLPNKSKDIKYEALHRTNSTATVPTPAPGRRQHRSY